MKHQHINKIMLAGLLVIAFALPLVIRSATYLHILVLLFFYAYLTTSWNIVGGFAGVLPLGHAAFVGIGAYTSTILSLQYGVSPWLGMLVGGVLATIVGVIISLPTLKMRGAYFALATIAFAEGIRVMVENIDYIGPLKLNGPRGLQIPPLETGLASFMFASKEPYYYIILIMLLAVMLLTYLISRAKLGYYLMAGGEEPEAAMALGINVRPRQTDRHGDQLVFDRAGRDLLRPVLPLHPPQVDHQPRHVIRDRLHRPDRRPGIDRRAAPGSAAAPAGGRLLPHLFRRHPAGSSSRDLRPGAHLRHALPAARHPGADQPGLPGTAEPPDPSTQPWEITSCPCCT